MVGTVAESLASRVGAALACLTLAAICLTAGLYFDGAATAISDTQSKIARHQKSKGHAAFNELLRAALIVEEAAQTRNTDDAFKRDLSRALDFLFVRAEHLANRREMQVDLQGFNSVVQRRLERGRSQATSDIRALIERIDASFASDFSDLDRLSIDVLELSGAARVSLFSYLEDLERAENSLVASQSTILVRLSRSTWLFLALILLAGVTSILLLRREVMSRKLHKEAEERASYLAYYDSLTGLPNRISFRDMVAKRLESKGAPLTLMILDIDGFKEINDRIGTKEGDAVLKELGRRIGLVADEYGAFAARLGADQFAVGMDTENVVVIRQMGQSLLRRTASPIETPDASVQIHLSIGAASRAQIEDDVAPTPGTLMTVVEYALGRAKRDGGNRIVEYDTSLKHELSLRRVMLEELPEAIARGDLEVFLQPKVIMETGDTVGFEALVRWRRDGNIVPPGEFISIAEESGLIIELDTFVLDRAVQIVSAWNAAHRTNFGVSVNISALHLFSSELAATVPAVLDRWKLEPHLLTLEITESVELNDWTRVGGALYALKHSGCRISIDDFGTGYSSLAYLRAIPADELKIDKSLVDEIETVEEAKFILDAVLDLATSLNLDVVVEGIERPSQVTTLMSFGCAYGQGYYFGRPLPAEESLAAATASDAADAPEDIASGTG